LSAADWAARRADAFAEAADAFATNPNGYGGGGSSGSGSSDDGAWVEVCSGQVFRPSAADVGRRVRLECRCVSRDGTLLFGPKALRLEPTLARPPPPLPRPAVAVQGAAHGGGYRFRVVTYNLLADLYATQHAYPDCDAWALSWGYRAPNLLRELTDAAADVLCLQEVQADHFEQHLQPRLLAAGFDGLYKPKTRDAMGLSGKVDGCAVFWRRTKFRLAEHYGVEFNACARALAQQIATSAPHEREIVSRVTKDNVGMVAVLEVLLPGPAGQRAGRLHNQRTGNGGGGGPLQVAVANTHLYSNKDFPDVKLWQCLSLVRELEQLVLARDLPLVVCGDFNSVPSSAVYALLAHAAVPADHPDLKVKADEEEEEEEEKEGEEEFFFVVFFVLFFCLFLIL
jgi:CCR4-NOT transcription complex subunit 6